MYFCGDLILERES